MFDFRYHIASLIAVFIALVIGILVGIGLSGRGFVSDAERKNLDNQISELTGDRNAARSQLADATRRQAATAHYADQTYLALVKGRLEQKRIGVVFLGSVNQAVDTAVAQAIRAAGGRVLRLRALRIPIDDKAVERIVANRPALRDYAGTDRCETSAGTSASSSSRVARPRSWTRSGTCCSRSARGAGRRRSMGSSSAGPRRRSRA